MFDRVAWAVRMTGADYGQFRTILAAKLTLDNRRQTLARFSQQETSQPKGLLASLGFFVFMVSVGVAMLRRGPVSQPAGSD